MAKGGGDYMKTINGMVDNVEVLTSIKENIQDGNSDTAIDMINQLMERWQPQPCTPDEMTSEEKTRFLDARDQHLIRQNLNKATGGR